MDIFCMWFINNKYTCVSHEMEKTNKCTPRLMELVF